MSRKVVIPKKSHRSQKFVAYKRKGPIIKAIKSEGAQDDFQSLSPVQNRQYSNQESMIAPYLPSIAENRLRKPNNRLNILQQANLRYHQLCNFNKRGIKYAQNIKLDGFLMKNSKRTLLEAIRRGKYFSNISIDQMNATQVVKNLILALSNKVRGLTLQSKLNQLKSDVELKLQYLQRHKQLEKLNLSIYNYQQGEQALDQEGSLYFKQLKPLRNLTQFSFNCYCSKISTRAVDCLTNSIQGKPKLKKIQTLLPIVEGNDANETSTSLNQFYSQVQSLSHLNQFSLSIDQQSLDIKHFKRIFTISQFANQMNIYLKIHNPVPNQEYSYLQDIPKLFLSLGGRIEGLNPENIQHLKSIKRRIKQFSFSRRESVYSHNRPFFRAFFKQLAELDSLEKFSYIDEGILSNNAIESFKAGLSLALDNVKHTIKSLSFNLQDSDHLGSILQVISSSLEINCKEIKDFSLFISNYDSQYKCDEAMFNLLEILSQKKLRSFSLNMKCYSIVQNFATKILKSILDMNSLSKLSLKGIPVTRKQSLSYFNRINIGQFEGLDEIRLDLLSLEEKNSSNISRSQLFTKTQICESIQRFLQGLLKVASCIELKIPYEIKQCDIDSILQNLKNSLKMRCIVQITRGVNGFKFRQS